jgi:hypothetical protein
MIARRRSGPGAVANAPGPGVEPSYQQLREGEKKEKANCFDVHPACDRRASARLGTEIS